MVFANFGVFFVGRKASFFKVCLFFGGMGGRRIFLAYWRGALNSFVAGVLNVCLMGSLGSAKRRVRIILKVFGTVKKDLKERRGLKDKRKYLAFNFEIYGRL